MCNLYHVYKNRFSSFADRMMMLDLVNLHEYDNMFPNITLEKASAYSIQNSDVLIFTLFNHVSIPPMWANYIKMPNNKILLDKFIKNKDLVSKKISESFEMTIEHNKCINKKTKSLFSFDELRTIKNKQLMGVEMIEVYAGHGFEDFLERIKEAIDTDKVSFIAISYLLSYLCFDDEDREKIIQKIKEKSDFLLEKVRFQIDVFFDFAIGVLRISQKDRYDVFVDTQLMEIADYTNKEKEQIMKAFSNDEKKYLDIIDMLTKELNQLRKENDDLKSVGKVKNLPLKSKNILVVGDTGRKDSYREVVERYGGNFDFMDGIYEPEKISSLVDKTDLAILIIPRMKHSVSNILKSKKVSTIFVNSAGISSFEEVMTHYCCG